MLSPIRGLFTFFGVVAAGFLLWLSTQFGAGTTGYWERLGVIAAAGLALVLAQLFGGWTKWGVPRLATNVLVLGFVPALIVGGWILLAGQPDDNWFQRHVLSWSGDLHVERLVRHFRERYVGVIAFGLGAVLGFAFDTTGPRAPAVTAPRHPFDEPVVAEEPPTALLAPEPVVAEHPLAPPADDAPTTRLEPDPHSRQG